MIHVRVIRPRRIAMAAGIAAMLIFAALAQVAVASAPSIVPGTVFAADSAKVDSLIAPPPAESTKVAPAKTEEPKVELAPSVPKPVAPVKQKKVRGPKKPKEKKPPHVHLPEAGPWDTGAEWFTVRAGYNKATYRTAGEGNVGLGFGAMRMLNTGWGLGLLSEWNVLGKFGDATESEIPFTVELDRHLKWGDQFRPYFGFGGGTYYHKFSKTTADRSEVRGGGFVAVGGNAVVSPHGLIGLDARVAFVSAFEKPPVDPVFGAQEQTTTRYSVKIGWSVTY